MANIGEDITQKLIEIGEIKLGMKVLDLGCGNGDVTAFQPKFINWVISCLCPDYMGLLYC